MASYSSSSSSHPQSTTLPLPLPLPPLCYIHQFRWDSSVPDSVAVKGSFDNWSSTLLLNKERSGKFGAKIELNWGAKISYKYVVDGHWRHNPNEPTEPDPDGNINNVFLVPALPQTPPQLPGPHLANSSDLLPVSPPTLQDPASPVPSPSPVSELLPSMSPPSPILFPSPPLAPSPDHQPLPQHQPAPRRTLSLAPRPQPLRQHRSTSQHAHSLLLAAPRTPGDKASPAGASVSTVVSAMAGVAATAIPAAILAVTGKDILRPPSPTQNSSLNPTLNPPLTSTSPHPPGALLLQSDSSYGPPLTPEPTPELPRAPLMPVNDPDDTVESPPEPLSTHIPLPPSDGQSGNIKVDKVGPGMLDRNHIGSEESAKAVGTSAVTRENLAGTARDHSSRQASEAKVLTSGPVESSKVAKNEDSVEVAPGLAVKGEASALVESRQVGMGKTGVEAGPGKTAKDETSGEPESLKVGVSKTNNTSVEKIRSQAEPAEPSAKQLSGVPDTSIVATVAGSGATSELARDPSPAGGSPQPGRARLEGHSGKPRPAEQFVRKTSGWRYSVGSIRSRKASGEDERRRSGGGEQDERSTWSGVSSSRQRNGGAGEGVGGSPRKRKTSIFQKIKTVFTSPNRHGSRHIGSHDHDHDQHSKSHSQEGGGGM